MKYLYSKITVIRIYLLTKGKLVSKNKRKSHVDKTLNKSCVSCLIELSTQCLNKANNRAKFNDNWLEMRKHFEDSRAYYIYQNGLNKCAINQ